MRDVFALEREREKKWQAESQKEELRKLEMRVGDGAYFQIAVERRAAKTSAAGPSAQAQSVCKRSNQIPVGLCSCVLTEPRVHNETGLRLRGVDHANNPA
jgi:hypothetical protein